MKQRCRVVLTVDCKARSLREYRGPRASHARRGRGTHSVNHGLVATTLACLSRSTPKYVSERDAPPVPAAEGGPAAADMRSRDGEQASAVNPRDDCGTFCSDAVSLCVSWAESCFTTMVLT